MPCSPGFESPPTFIRAFIYVGGNVSGPVMEKGDIKNTQSAKYTNHDNF